MPPAPVLRPQLGVKEEMLVAVTRLFPSIATKRVQVGSVVGCFTLVPDR